MYHTLMEKNGTAMGPGFFLFCFNDHHHNLSVQRARPDHVFRRGSLQRICAHCVWLSCFSLRKECRCAAGCAKVCAKPKTCTPGLCLVWSFTTVDPQIHHWFHFSECVSSSRDPALEYVKREATRYDRHHLTCLVMFLITVFLFFVFYVSRVAFCVSFFFILC